MTDDSRQENALTDEQVAELVRARKARTKYGVVLLLVGAVGFIATLGMMLKRPEGVPNGLAILTVCFAMTAVGSGFADPSEIKALWGRG